MRLLWLVPLILAILSAAAGITLCEGVTHVRRNIEFHDPPAYLRGIDFTWQNASITVADGGAMKGWFLEPAKNPEAVCALILHGIGDTRLGALRFAPMFLRHGYAILAPDSRGHGQSDGPIVTYGVRESDDALRWAAWLTSHGCRKVVGLGESLGAAILLEAAGQKPAFQAVVAEGAYASFPAIGTERLARGTGVRPAVARLLVWPVLETGMLWAKWHLGADLASVNPTEAVRRTTTPILLIHGLADNLTSPDNSRAIAAASPHAELWLVPGARHVGASWADPLGFENRVFDFLKRNQK